MERTFGHPGAEQAAAVALYSISPKWRRCQQGRGSAHGEKWQDDMPAMMPALGGAHRPADLARHQCITIRQGDEAYGLWRLERRGPQRTAESVKARGALSTNDGGIAVSWALDGHGILMRAEWDIARHLESGRLVQVLSQYDTPDADIHAVYPQGHQNTRRVRAFVDFLAAEFAQPRG